MPKNSYKSFPEIIKSGKTPTIMQIVPAVDSGGVEQGVIDINKAIVKAGGKSIVLSNGGRRVPEITRDGGVHVELPVHSKNPFTMLKNIKAIRKVIEEYDVDIVHACSRAPAWSAKPAAKKTKAKYMSSCHAAHKLNFPGKRFYNSSVINGDLVIAISHTLADHLKENYKFDHDKLRVVQRGIVMEKYDPEKITTNRVIELATKWRIPDDKLLIIFPARVSPIKGHKFFIEALKETGRKDIFCAIVGRTEGNEEYAAELERYIEEVGMGSQVRLVGTCQDMPVAYKLANAVVCPSLVPEGFGRIPVEAMAMGKPFIGTDLGGYRETVKSGENGWLVEVNNVKELSKAIDTALSMNDKEREAFAEKAIKYVRENFTNKKMCEKTLDVYAELLGTK